MSRHGRRRSRWCGRRSPLVGALLALAVGAAQALAAQGPAQAWASVPPSPPVAPRLSVRPRQLATGTRTEQAGHQTLELGGGKRAEVYVPTQCVGTRRCPLVLCIACSSPAQQPADRYGMIVFELNSPGDVNNFLNEQVSVDPGVPFLVRETQPSGTEFIRLVDSALTRLLRTYAIDPEKIALAGNSFAGAWSIILGRTNPDVFSRVAPRAPATGMPLDSPIPPVPTTQYTFVGGVADAGMFFQAVHVALVTRRDGYPATIVLVPQGHIGSSGPDIPDLFRWFHESWAAPEAARRAAQPRPVAPGPLVTADAFRRWNIFWTRFMAEPEAIRDTARRAHIKRVPTMVGRQPVQLLMMDLPALAAQYPSVVADLKAAGLTARQAEAYRTALLSAWTTLELRPIEREYREVYGDLVGAEAVAPQSVLGRNMAFLAAQPELVERLRHETDQTLWTTVP